MWKKIRSSQLITVSFFTAISTGVKMIAAFITAKIIAVYLGPSGMGVIGQLNSFVLIVLAIATGSINNGVVKYLAEFSDNKEQQKSLIKAAFNITIICSIFVSLIITIFSGFWSEYIFNGDKQFRLVFIIFGGTIIFYSLFSLFVSILNGFKEYKKYNIINIIASVAGMLFTVILVFYFGIYGALVSIVTYQSIVFIVAAVMIVKSGWFDVKGLFVFENKELYFKLFKFSLMSLVTTLCVPYGQILIRKYLTTHVGADITGFYESVSRISTIYLTITTTTLSVYYLPRLSELKEVQLLRKEIIHGYKILIPLLIIFIGLVFLFRNVIINIAFTVEFLPMSAYFLPQLIGDFFKICSWLLAFMMLAKAMTGLFIITEIFFSVTLVILAMFMINIYGGIGAIYAYTINYMLYFVTMLIAFRKVLFHK